ncbi:hypothetical protein LIER_31697 [Lithospermum erythrorhizon]|uniref:Uncharacterized protein n=1 Tax=Lithospermum erythrorhizon TaxID=34254 RepID=A0AAV3RTY9_LITER
MRDDGATMKIEEEYSDDEEELARANSKALNSIFCGVDANMFKMINQCYGHTESKCATFLRRQNKNYYTSSSDDKSEKDKDDVAFMVSVDSGSASEESPIGRGNDGDITNEEVFEHYEVVFEDWNDLRKTAEQQEEIQRLNLQLERMMRNLRMINVGTSKLDEIMQIGRTPGDVSGIGYEYQEEGTQTGQRQVPPGHDRSQTRLVYLEQGQRTKKGHMLDNKVIVEWPLPLEKRKTRIVFAHIVARKVISEYIYLNCMAKEGANTVNPRGEEVDGKKGYVLTYEGADVTFGDGRKGQIIGKERLNVKVKFNKDGCKVSNEDKVIVLRGKRSDENCYKCIPVVKKDKELGESSRIKSEEDPGNCQYQFQLLQHILTIVEKEDLSSSISGCWESYVIGEKCQRHLFLCSTVQHKDGNSRIVSYNEKYVTPKAVSTRRCKNLKMVKNHDNRKCSWFKRNEGRCMLGSDWCHRLNKSEARFGFSKYACIVWNSTEIWNHQLSELSETCDPDCIWKKKPRRKPMCVEDRKVMYNGGCVNWEEDQSRGRSICVEINCVRPNTTDKSPSISNMSESSKIGQHGNQHCAETIKTLSAQLVESLRSALGLYTLT